MRVALMPSYVKFDCNVDSNIYYSESGVVLSSINISYITLLYAIKND